MMKGSFRIDINQKISLRIIEQISMSFGDNTTWYYPLDESDIAYKPVIKVKDDYYCFLIPILFWDAVPIIEAALSEAQKDELNYYKKKSKFFEEKTLELLGTCLKGSKVFAGLHYSIMEDGVPKWPEIDGIIVFRRCLLLIEVKAKGKRDTGNRRDELTIIESNLKRNIAEAFIQSKRAYEYISSSETAVFEKEKGKPELELKKNDFEVIFLINVTSESFESFMADLNSLKQFSPELLKGDYYPFVVNIHDLMVLTDLLNNGDDLVEYLKQRIRINTNTELKALDEMVFLGYYLEKGSLNRTEDLSGLQSPLVHGHSEKIDRWYSFQRGEIDSAERPALKRSN